MLKPPQPEHNLPHWLAIGFSGHRHLGQHANPSANAIRKAIDKLALRCPRIAGVSSAAFGSDTLFAEEILRRHAPLSIVLPFPCERFKQDFEGEPTDAWQRSEEITRRAVNLDVVHQLDADVAMILESGLSPEEQNKLRRARDAKAYWEATVRTVDRSDVLFAIWDGKPGKGEGGTADAVKYARKIGLPLIIFNPETGLFIEERLGNLFEDNSGPTNPPTNPREMVQKYFEQLDRVASKHGPNTRKIIRKYIYLNLAASAVGAASIIISASLGLSLFSATFEVALLIYATYMLRNRGKLYKEWLSRRVEAEICRSFLHTWNIRRHPMLGHQPRPAVPNQRRLFDTLHFLRQLDISPWATLGVVTQEYLKDRVQDQLTYFDEKHKTAQRTYASYVRWSRVCTIGGTMAGLTVFILLIINHSNHFIDFFVFLDIVLPLGTTALGFLMVTEEASRRVTRYAQMKSAMERLKPIVEAAPTWEALARAATQVEEELLQELVEWESFVRNTEHLH